MVKELKVRLGWRQAEVDGRCKVPITARGRLSVHVVDRRDLDEHSEDAGTV